MWKFYYKALLKRFVTSFNGNHFIIKEEYNCLTKIVKRHYLGTNKKVSASSSTFAFVRNTYTNTSIDDSRDENVRTKNETNTNALEKKKKTLLKFEERDNTNYIDANFRKYEIDESFCSYIIKKKKFLNLIPYKIKQHQENVYYKKSDGTNNAFLFSNIIKPLQHSERVSNILLVHSLVFDEKINKTVKRNLFDILYKKYSLIFFFKNTDHINEMDKYLYNFEKKKKWKNIDEEEKINFDNYLKIKKKQIHLYYCYVSSYKYLLGDYFTKKISENLRANYFKNKNFFFMNKRLNINEENCFLLDTSLPSLVLVDDSCFIRYHIKGLFTEEASYYLFKVLHEL